MGCYTLFVSTWFQQPGFEQDRERYMASTLAYAYAVASEFSTYPILGSLIRAVGKGWKVAVVASKKRAPVYRLFQRQLRDPSQVLVAYVDDLSGLRRFHELVLIDGASPVVASHIRHDHRVLGKSHVMAVEVDPEEGEYDLISRFEKRELHPAGVVAITGTGKGKTTSALGLGGEVVAHGGRVAVVQWFKERKSGSLTWAISEHAFSETLTHPGAYEFFPSGLGFYGSPHFDRVAGERAYRQHRDRAYKGLALARRLIGSGDYSLVVLDELVDTVAEIAHNIRYPLIDLVDLVDFLAFATGQTQTKLVVTGRRVTDGWAGFVKTSWVIAEVKHPWSFQGRGAVSGLDF